MASPLKADTARRARAVRLCAPEVVIDRRADGTLYLNSPHKLDPYAGRLTDRLVYWAETAPDRVFMAERDGGSWRTITYRQTLAEVRRIGEALLRKGLSADRPVVILSGNDLEHALLGLAANFVGIPYAPISPAYALISSDFGKLRHIVNLLTPGLVFACNGTQYARAIEAVVPPDVEVVVTRNQLANRPMTLFAQFSVQPTTAVDAAHANVTPDTIAKFLFTSGSTGMPKGVVNTQRMWCANQGMLRSALQYFRDEPPVIVDWAPWHHTAGGNHDVGLVLYNGGTMYIDAGKPLPGAIEETVRNLHEIAPTWYFNVPKGYEALLPFFRADAALRENFFSRLKVLWFAGAGLAQHVFDEWKDLAHRTCGEDILFLTGLGSTETAPYAFGRMWNAENSANIGLPPPGLDVKLVPLDGKYEARLRGPNITPGYWREPQLTAEAFDAEGFYKLGDALKFDDPAKPEKGLLFDGRIAEDFKLGTGTWVSVGPLRAAFIAHCAPFVKDVVIAGADRDFIGVLIFPDLDACRRLAPDLANAGALDIVAHEGVRREFRFLLDRFAKAATGSSNRIARAILLDAPPSLDVGEATDKGSINQRMVLRHRVALVQELYASTLPPRVIAIGEK
jgi:feruloyl-CoA synthase